MKKEMIPDGAKRTVRKFAWFPKCLDDGWKIWLEHYWADQEFKHSQDIIFKYGFWYDKKSYLKHPSNTVNFLTEKK
jgi:hypothetical protein